jgi:hypothetical protein
VILISLWRTICSRKRLSHERCGHLSPSAWTGDCRQSLGLFFEAKKCMVHQGSSRIFD